MTSYIDARGSMMIEGERVKIKEIVENDYIIFIDVENNDLEYATFYEQFLSCFKLVKVEY